MKYYIINTVRLICIMFLSKENNFITKFDFSIHWIIITIYNNDIKIKQISLSKYKKVIYN